jgi:hypothetical protein
MIKVKEIEKGLMEVKSTVRINHPAANLMTLQIGHDAACNFPLTVECAFSNGYWFLTDIIPDFAPYAFLLDDSKTFMYYNMRQMDHEGLVMTYHHVPIALVAKFLNIYAEKV